MGTSLDRLSHAAWFDCALDLAYDRMQHERTRRVCTIGAHVTLVEMHMQPSNALTRRRVRRHTLAPVCLICVALSSHNGFAQPNCEVVQAEIKRQSSILANIVKCLREAPCKTRVMVENLRNNCRKTTYAWPGYPTERVVVINDIKMCIREGDSDDPTFVHGLVMPMESVTGIEDDKLYAPDAAMNELWQVAWTEATKRLDEQEITLVVNPPTNRGQNHLHIHIARRNGTSLSPDAVVLNLPDLHDVWNRAQAEAQRHAFACRNYGVMVFKTDTSFGLLLEPADPIRDVNPEGKYTKYLRSR